jgi:hypothetical protein
MFDQTMSGLNQMILNSSGFKEVWANDKVLIGFRGLLTRTPKSEALCPVTALRDAKEKGKIALS